MTKSFLLFFLMSMLTFNMAAQDTADRDSVKKDSLGLRKKIRPKDTLAPVRLIRKDSTRTLNTGTPLTKTDSVMKVVPEHPFNLPQEPDLFRTALMENPNFNFYGKIQAQDIIPHKASSREWLFYLMIGLFFYYAFIRLFFWKYLGNIFSLFFRATMRKQQIREQALQTPLPSLFLNVLFVFSSGLYASFLIRHYHLVELTGFWLLYVYCIIGITVIYLAKFSILKICGWIFNVRRAADNYIFMVFLVNKMLGICLLPFLMIIAFSDAVLVEIAFALSFVMIAILLLYRFIACFGSLRTEIKLNVLHYFIYLCAFEIAPLLLIYKLVLSFLKKGY